MAERSRSGKKVVRAEPVPDRTGGDHAEPDADWTPTAAAKGQASRNRLIAAALWVVAIAGELFAIFWALQQDPVNLAILIGLLVAIGALSIGGSLLWKQANRLDPARRSEPVRFFVQNQLGAIIAVVAFLPLILLILADKDLPKRDKAIAGAIGGILLVVATLFGIDRDAPSVEQYGQETDVVVEATGRNLVYWTKEGKVFHLCEDASAVNLESKDNKIYSGTVAEAHADGKDRLTKQVDQERRQCGFDAVTSTTPPATDPDGT